MDSLPKVLFVCTYRGGRSQIAHAYAKKHAHGIFESDCACFDPGTISSEFVELIASLGLTIKNASPESAFSKDKRKVPFQFIICLCSDASTEMCSLFRMNIDKIFPNASERLHWDISDFGACAEAPEGFKACVEKTCSDIEQHVLSLVEKVKAQC